MGKLIHESVNIFQIETAVNTRMYGGMLDFLHKNEDRFNDWSEVDGHRESELHFFWRWSSCQPHVMLRLGGYRHRFYRRDSDDNHSLELG